MNYVSPAEARRRAMLANAEAAAAVAKTFDRSISPDVEGRTAAERVGRVLDVHEHRGGVDREVLLTVASYRSRGEMVDLAVADLRELIRPEHRLLLAVSTALDPIDGDDVPDYTAARELLATLDEEALMRLVALFNEAKDLAVKGYREGARRRAIAEHQAKEANQS